MINTANDEPASPGRVWLRSTFTLSAVTNLTVFVLTVALPAFGVVSMCLTLYAIVADVAYLTTLRSILLWSSLYTSYVIAMVLAFWMTEYRLIGWAVLAAAAAIHSFCYIDSGAFGTVLLIALSA